MRKKVMKIGGVVSFLIGCVFILNSFSGITGFAVADSVGKGVSGILGLVFIFGGVAVFVVNKRKEKRSGLERTAKQTKTYKKAQVALKSRAMGKYRDLRKMANGMGYVVKNATGHYKVYFSNDTTPLTSPDGHPVTIPRHDEKAGTYFGILKNLVNNNPYQP